MLVTKHLQGEAGDAKPSDAHHAHHAHHETAEHCLGKTDDEYWMATDDGFYPTDWLRKLRRTVAISRCKKYVMWSHF